MKVVFDYLPRRLYLNHGTIILKNDKYYVKERKKSVEKIAKI